MTKPCEYCWTALRGESQRKQHMSVAYCRDYRRTLFVCRGCKFTTRGIRNIDEHNKTCTVPEDEWSRDPYNDLLLRVQQLEGVIDPTPEGYLGLLERIQKLESSAFGGAPPPLPMPDESPPQKRKTYKSVKAVVDLVPEEDDDERQCRIQKVNKEKAALRKKFGNVEACIESIDKLFEEMRDSKTKTYTNGVSDIRKLRCSLIGSMSLGDYEMIVRSHVLTLTEFFTAKGWKTKKTRSAVSRGLSPLESRMLHYGSYYEYHLEIDEIQQFEAALGLSVVSPQEYVPFDAGAFYSNFLNYGSVLFPIMDVISRHVGNAYGFHSVVYVEIPKSSDDDPYSFYTLESVSKTRRDWDMDCRLEGLTHGLIANILPYLIGIFRRMYCDVFGDNEYRDDYSAANQLMECDCAQLVSNILDMSIPRVVGWRLRDIVKTKCTHPMTDRDKTNLTGDDGIQKKRLASDKDDPDYVDTVRQLFDNISSEHAVDFYRARCRSE